MQIDLAMNQFLHFNINFMEKKSIEFFFYQYVNLNFKRFLAAPVTIFVAAYAIPAYMREKTVHGTEIAVFASGHIFFLVCYTV